MSNLSILNREIRQKDGLFLLNDLHKASGGHENHRPSKFVRNAQTKDLINEITLSPNMGLPAETKALPLKNVRGVGTYACKQIVVSYAAWISPKIHLAVLNVFLAAQDSAPKQEADIVAIEAPKINKEQRGHLFNVVAGMASKNGTTTHPVWLGLKKHFGYASYKDLTPEQYPEACQFLGVKPISGELMPTSNAMPDEQAKAIMDNLHEVQKIFHPFSDQFYRLCAVTRILRGLTPDHGTPAPKYKTLMTQQQVQL